MIIKLATTICAFIWGIDTEPTEWFAFPFLVIAVWFETLVELVAVVVLGIGAVVSMVGKVRQWKSSRHRT